MYIEELLNIVYWYIHDVSVIFELFLPFYCVDTVLRLTADASGVIECEYIDIKMQQRESYIIYGINLTYTAY